MYCPLHARKKVLFQNKGIGFLDRAQLNSDHFRYYFLPRPLMLGILFIIEDEFLCLKDTRFVKIRMYHIGKELGWWNPDVIKYCLINLNLAKKENRREFRITLSSV